MEWQNVGFGFANLFSSQLLDFSCFLLLCLD
jgi:hypothetical protein